MSDRAWSRAELHLKLQRENRHMADKPWKKFERDIAAIFGTTRALMKGTDEVKDIGPEDDFPLVLDCKLWKQQNWQIVNWFRKLENAAPIKVAGEDPGVSAHTHVRWPVLCVREPGKKRKYALVRRVYIMNFITDHTSPPLTANDFYHWQAKGFGPKTLVDTWEKMMKEMQDNRRVFGSDPSALSEDAIPMMSMDHGKGTKLTVFRPEDLARLFRIGGILKDG